MPLGADFAERALALSAAVSLVVTALMLRWLQK